MKHALACSLAILFAGFAMAGEPIDSARFYADRPGQVFKGSSPQSMNIGYIEGDETPYQTWEGMLSGKKLYVELHGDQLKIQAGRRKFRRNLGSAFKLPSEQTAALDFRGTDLYVFQGKGAHGSALCMESLPAEVNRSTPHRSVYLLADPLGRPRLYQFPTLYASCKGLTEVKLGVYMVPWWSASIDTIPPTFSIEFYKLNPMGFTATGQRVKAMAVDDQLDKFVIDMAE